MIAGSGISHLVKVRPTLVLLRSSRIVRRHLDAVLVTANRGCCQESTKDTAVEQ